MTLGRLLTFSELQFICEVGQNPFSLRIIESMGSELPTFKFLCFSFSALLASPFPTLIRIP